ncbi:aspartate carbamoyltransferase catalytic subunit [Sinisalibacter aestuarii]|nr:aspartate carbamoyltransferase catalytic subunit [Sinisalibacter aestuarii]
MTETSEQPYPAGVKLRDVPAGWEGILDPGERILWQGRPDQAFHLRLSQIPMTLFGLFFAGFALFWMVMAARRGGIFWMFGLIHFTAGLAIIFNATYWGTMKRRHTWYTLTDRRAFIATDLPVKGRSLASYAITPETRLTWREEIPGTVYFAREDRRGNKGRSYSVDIGFERIDDSGKVYGLMRKVQRSQAPEAEA